MSHRKFIVKKDKNKLPPLPSRKESEPVLRSPSGSVSLDRSSYASLNNIPASLPANLTTSLSASLDNVSIFRKQSEPLPSIELSPKSEIPSELISAKENGKDYKIAIATTETRQDTKTMFTVYKIEVSVGTKAWIIEKRFRDFRDLHIRLKQAAIKDKLPDLPHRKMFGSSLDPLFVEQRRVKLQKYVEELLKLSDTITKSYCFLSFFKSKHRSTESL